MCKRNKSVLMFAILAIIGFSGIYCGQKTYAASGESIIKKWEFTQYYQCVRDQIRTPIAQKNSGVVANDVFDTSAKMPLPSYNYQHSVSSGSVNCRSLLTGGNGLPSGILEYAGLGTNTNWSNTAQSTAFLNALGYTQGQAAGGQQQFELIAHSRAVNAYIDGAFEGETSSVHITATDGASGPIYQKNGSDFFSTIKVNLKDDSLEVSFQPSVLSGCTLMKDSSENPIRISYKNKTIEQFYSDVKSGLSNKVWTIACNANMTTYWFDASDLLSSGAKADFTYDKNSYDTSNNAIRGLSGMDLRGLGLDNSERYTLYVYYLDKTLPSATVPNRLTADPSDKNGLTKIRLKGEDGTFKDFYANFNGKDLKSVTVYTQQMTENRSGKSYPMITTITMDKVINWLNTVDTKTLTDVAAVTDTGQGVSDGGEDDGGEESVEPTCANSGAAESLGWILCPILTWMTNAADTVYDDLLEPALRVEPKLFTESPDSGTRNAWGLFQNFANIIFIILLLVVIFSQLTGVGIDNYGIKKILPKLILVAVLINLSYIICLLAIDTSNIVGNGLQTIFNQFNPDLSNASVSVGDGSVGLGAGWTTALTGVGLLGVLVGGVWLAAGAGSVGAILLALLVSALSILISILFLFILLAAREAAIIVLTVISPLAFVCFMLPNTKKYYDRWWKFFYQLLLVYPIAGLLVGGGNFVSKLLLSAGGSNMGFFLAFTSMIAGVVPIFFIPTVLQNSFTALGNLGSKISGFGRNMGGRLSGAVDRRVRGTAGFQEGLKNNQYNQALRRANRINSKYAGRDDLTKRQQRRLYAAQSTLIADKDAEQRAKNMARTGFQAAGVAIEKKADAEAVANEMTLINNATRNGEDTEKLYSMFDDYMAAGNKQGAIAVARIAGRRKDTASDFLGSRITGRSVDKATGREAITNAAAGYDKKMLSSVMKEISTGENSSNYRSSSPLGFEFAAQFNRAYREDENGVPIDGAGEANYGMWRSDAGNVDRTVSNYMTDSGELVGAKNSALGEINSLMETGQMSSSEANRLRILANDTINSKDTTGVWDSTKAENIYRMAGRLDEYNKMINKNNGAGANGGGIAGEGEVFAVNNAREVQQNGAATNSSNAASNAGVAPAGTGHGNPQVVGGSVTTIYRDGTPPETKQYKPMPGHEKDGMNHITKYEDSKK